MGGASTTLTSESGNTTQPLTISKDPYGANGDVGSTYGSARGNSTPVTTNTWDESDGNPPQPITIPTTSTCRAHANRRTTATSFNINITIDESVHLRWPASATRSRRRISDRQDASINFVAHAVEPHPA